MFPHKGAQLETYSMLLALLLPGSTAFSAGRTTLELDVAPHNDKTSSWRNEGAVPAGTSGCCSCNEAEAAESSNSMLRTSERVLRSCHIR